MARANAEVAQQEQVQVSVRLPTTLAKALEEKAEREDRTFSAELRRAIKRHVFEPVEEVTAA